MLCCGEAPEIKFSPGLLEQKEEAAAWSFGGCYVTQCPEHPLSSDHIIHGDLRLTRKWHIQQMVLEWLATSCVSMTCDMKLFEEMLRINKNVSK